MQLRLESLECLCQGFARASAFSWLSNFLKSLCLCCDQSSFPDSGHHKPGNQRRSRLGGLKSRGDSGWRAKSRGDLGWKSRGIQSGKAKSRGDGGWEGCSVWIKTFAKSWCYITFLSPGSPDSFSGDGDTECDCKHLINRKTLF